MMKFNGMIGYAETIETKPGVWTKQITERPYYGDLNRITKRFQSTENLNDDLVISNELSIVSDPFANENFHLMQYVEYMGVKWKVTNVEIQYPRLILTLGGVYNS